MNNQPNRWLGTGRVLMRTRAARRRGDIAAALRALTQGKTSAAGISLRGRKILILLQPDLAGKLLVESAGQTKKGPGLQLTRPLLGNGLLVSEGADHARARRLVAPAFASSRLKSYVDTFARTTLARVETWQDGQTLDLHEQLAGLTLDVVGKTLLGMDLSSDATGIRAALERSLEFFEGENLLLSGRRKPARSSSADVVAADPVHAIIDDIIDARRKSCRNDQQDVLSALLSAESGADGLSPSEVHDQVMTLLMAGHETTANALSWTMMLLSQYPHVRARLHSELDTLGGRVPGWDDLASLSFTRAVITEAMRLYPPVWIIGRTLLTAIEFEGWHAPAGTTVAVSPLLLHHDARWFEDPERFDPDRWLDERRAAVPRYAYLPFGTGPRSCIGEQFAWAEATTLLAVIASHWTAELDPAHTVVAQYRVTLRPGNGLPVRLRRRAVTPSVIA